MSAQHDDESCDFFDSEEIIIGRSRLTMRYFHNSKHPSIRYLYHEHFNLDPLYKFGTSNSVWWRILDFLRGAWPAWFLPRRVVLKTFDGKEKDKYTSLLNEVAGYNKLETVQGTLVPRFYGEVTLGDQPAVALQFIPGPTFHVFAVDLQTKCSNSTNEIEIDRFRNQLSGIREQLREIADSLDRLNVLGDVHGNNFICGFDATMMIDFDAYEGVCNEQQENNSYYLKIMLESYRLGGH